MLALSSAISMAANSNIERVLNESSCLTAPKFDVQDGFIAAEKWQLLEASPFDGICGSRDTLREDGAVKEA
jgi:hypothetical protein